MSEKFKLPRNVKDEIEELKIAEKKQGFTRIGLLITGGGSALLLVGAIIYFSLTPTPSGGNDSLPPMEIAAATFRPESTEESPDKPMVEPTETPTEEQAVEPTEETIEEPIVESIETPPEVAMAESPSEELVAESTDEQSTESTEELVIEPTVEAINEIDTATLPGKIAVPVFNPQNQTYDLYLVTGPEWQFPSQPFQTAASQPGFSPDGTELIFRSWGGATTSYGEQLVRRSLNGSGERLVTRNLEDARPHWSSTEPEILLHTRPSGLSSRIYLQGIWDGALDDADSRRDIAVGENPTWLADGRIVFASGQPQGNGLYVMDKNGENIQKLLDTNGFVAPQGSPQENVVVFSNGEDLYTLTITDGQSTPVPLTQTPQTRERLPVWSPDGQFIAFVADNQDNQWAVYIIRADGSGQAKLFDLPGSIDGKPGNVPAERAFGWFEEQLAWGP